MPPDEHERHASRLARHWDALAGDAPDSAAEPMGDDLDPALAETIHRLHVLAAAPAPAGSRERVWQRLHDTSIVGGVADSVPDVAPLGLVTAPNGRTPVAPFPSQPQPAERARRSWRVAELATAAVVALAILSGFLATRLAPSNADDDPPANAGIAATPTATPAAPGAEACLVAPRTMEEIRELAARATPVVVPTAAARRGGREWAITDPDGTVPAGIPADAATVAGVRATLHEVTACANAWNLMRVYALYSDNYLQAPFAARGSLVEFEARFAKGTPDPVPDEFRQRVPPMRNEDVRLLPDGRAGLVLREGGPTGTDNYLIFVKVGDRWLLDEEVLIAAGSAGTPEATPAITITLRDGSPDLGPEVLYLENLPADVDTTFRIENRGSRPRRFLITRLGVDAAIPPGESRFVTINAPAGTYALSVPGGGVGVTGTITVVSAGTPAPAVAPAVPITVRDGVPGRGRESPSLRVAAGVDTLFRIENRGSLPRRFVVADLGIDVHIPPGENRLVTVNAQEGEHAFSIPGGLNEIVGTLVVVGPDSPDISTPAGTPSPTRSPAAAKRSASRPRPVPKRRPPRPGAGRGTGGGRGRRRGRRLPGGWGGRRVRRRGRGRRRGSGRRRGRC